MEMRFYVHATINNLILTSEWGRLLKWRHVHKVYCMKLYQGCFLLKG